MIIWRKLTSAKWEDAWVERLAGFSDRLAVLWLPGGKTIRIEAYAVSKAEAAALVKQFGGQVRTLQDRIFTHQEKTTREPIRIREKLVIVSSQKEKKAALKKFPGRDILIVPAAMAFGSGEHATTAACLRLMVDLCQKQLPEGKWDMLDLGTGSGILAIGAKALGARKVDAFDFDPAAVRISKENAVLNGVNGIVFKKGDVTQWSPPRQWDVVAANLFSQVLIGAATTVAKATRKGGTLIFSGVMRQQEKETTAALVACGFRVVEVVRKGKWVTTLAVKERER